MIVRRYLKIDVRICFFPDWLSGAVEGQVDFYMYICACICPCTQKVWIKLIPHAMLGFSDVKITAAGSRNEL
jgi:hypothetical protein